MDLRSLMLGLVFALMWSSAFTSARMIVVEASPLAALSVRFLISGLLGVLIARFLGQTMRLTQAQWRATIVFGIFQNAIYLGLNFVAMQTIEASVASIIASSMPLPCLPMPLRDQPAWICAPVFPGQLRSPQVIVS